MLGSGSWAEVLSVYAASDLMVFPVVREPYGMVVIEALAAGVPVVSTPECGAASDLVQDGWNGYVVPPGDREAIAGRIRSFFSDPVLEMSMKRSAPEVI